MATSSHCSLPGAPVVVYELPISSWVEDAPPDGSADTKLSDPPQSMQAITPEANHKPIIVVYLNAPCAFSPATLSHPLASCPQRLLHLAALGHFQTIQRVAMRAEEPSHEVVAAAVLATSSVKLLPPVLVVTSILGDLDIFIPISLAWFCTSSLVKVIQSIAGALQICLEANQQISMLAGRPAPLVH